MHFRLENGSGLPITRQIADQIRTHCAAQTLRPGDRLPSVRELAEELAVNPNTVLRVYERLTAEGLLERKHGNGTFIAQRLPQGRLQAEREALTQEFDRLARRAVDLGLAPEDVRRLMDEAMERHRSDRPDVGGRTDV